MATGWMNGWGATVRASKSTGPVATPAKAGGLYGTGPGGPNPNAGQSQYNPGGIAPASTPYDAFGAANAAGQAYHAPDYAYLNQQDDYQRYQAGLGMLKAGNDKTSMQLQTQGQLNDIGTQLGINGIDQGAAQRQIPYLDALLASQLRGYGFQKDSANNTANSNRADLQSQMVANGAYQSRGERQGQGFITAGLLAQLGGIDENANQSKLTTEENKSQARDTEARLNLEAQGLGMKADNLKQQLDAGLSGIGIGQLMSSADLLNALNSNDYQRQQLARQIFNDALTYANQYQSVAK